MALGAIGTEDALQPMVQALTGGSEQLRQTMAEAFAAMPEEGYPTLYDAVTEEDFMLRRAAIFGLRRLRTTWALVAIYRAFLEDEQWYVRSAAQQAFQELTYGRSNSLTDALSQAGGNSLAARLGGASAARIIPPGEGAHQMLLRALQEGDAPIRTLAALQSGTAWHGRIRCARSTPRCATGARKSARPRIRRWRELQLQIGQPLPVAGVSLGKQ